jgi:hypothetical protein
MLEQQQQLSELLNSRGCYEVKESTSQTRQQDEDRLAQREQSSPESRKIAPSLKPSYDMLSLKIHHQSSQRLPLQTAQSDFIASGHDT